MNDILHLNAIKNLVSPKTIKILRGDTPVTREAVKAGEITPVSDAEDKEHDRVIHKYPHGTLVTLPMRALGLVKHCDPVIDEGQLYAAQTINMDRLEYNDIIYRTTLGFPASRKALHFKYGYGKYNDKKNAEENDPLNLSMGFSLNHVLEVKEIDALVALVLRIFFHRQAFGDTTTAKFKVSYTEEHQLIKDAFLYNPRVFNIEVGTAKNVTVLETTQLNRLITYIVGRSPHQVRVSAARKNIVVNYRELNGQDTTCYFSFTH